MADTYTIEVNPTLGRAVVSGPVPVDHLVAVVDSLATVCAATVVDARISGALGVTMVLRRAEDTAWRTELGLDGEVPRG